MYNTRFILNCSLPVLLCFDVGISASILYVGSILNMICEWVDVIIAGVSGRAFFPLFIKDLSRSKVRASDFFKDKHFTSFSTK